MTPSWLESHASFIDSYRSNTTEQLAFNAGSLDGAALLKVPIIPAYILENSSLVTLKIVASLDDNIGKNEDSDPRFGVSDGVSFVGFETVDKRTYPHGYAPCFGVEGDSGSSLTERREISKSFPKPNDSFYPGQFVITIKLNERRGSCYTAHDGGFEKTAVYEKRLLVSKGLTLEVYRDDKEENVGIRFMAVTVM